MGSANAHDNDWVEFSDDTLRIGNGTFTASSADPGMYAFSHWTVDGREVFGSITLTGNITATAVFERIVVVEPTTEAGVTVVDFRVVAHDRVGVYKVPEGASGVLRAYVGDAEIVLKDQSSLAGTSVTVTCERMANPGEIEGSAFELKFLSDGFSVCRDMTVTLPFTETGYPAVYHYGGSGDYEAMEVVSYGDGRVTFETDHNSAYIVTLEKQEEPTESKNSLVLVAAALIALLLVGIIFVYHQKLMVDRG